jgi:hypothetical protein
MNFIMLSVNKLNIVMLIVMASIFTMFKTSIFCLLYLSVAPPLEVTNNDFLMVFAVL